MGPNGGNSKGKRPAPAANGAKPQQRPLNDFFRVIPVGGDNLDSASSAGPVRASSPEPRNGAPVPNAGQPDGQEAEGLGVFLTVQDMQLPPLAPQEPNAALPLGAAAQGAPASSPVRTGSPPAGAQLLPQATTPPNRPELLSPLKAMAGGSGLSPNKTGGVFWGKSPNARQAQREMSSKIKATAGRSAGVLQFAPVEETETKRPVPTSPSGDNPESNQPSSSGGHKRPVFKRGLSFNDVYDAKEVSSSSSSVTQKRPKRVHHWAGQRDDLFSAQQATPASAGGVPKLTLTGLLSHASKFIGASTPGNSRSPPSDPVLAAPDSSNKRIARSPLDKSASASWIEAKKSPIPSSPPKPKGKAKPVETDPMEFELDVDLEMSLAGLDDMVPDISAGEKGVKAEQKEKKFRRYLVLETETREQGVMKEVTLRVFDEAERQEATVVLRDNWGHTVVGIGDYINVIGEPEQGMTDGSTKFIVNDQRNLLILHPDTLITSTQIAEIVHCVRKAVIDDRIKRAGDTNIAAQLGIMMHELIQTALKKADYSESFLEQEMERIVADKIETLYFLGQTEETARSHLRELITSFRSWAEDYLTDLPRTITHVPGRAYTVRKTAAFSIWKVVDIEENVWSPMLGIKGKIDASVCVRVTAPGKFAETFAVPLEIKCGGQSAMASHRAQTMIYSLLMSDRYGFEVGSGVLYYAKSGDTSRIVKNRPEMQGIIMGRNEMAGWLQAKKLPPMLQDLRKCQRCFAVDACTVYHKALENGNDVTSGLGLVFNDKTRDMTSQHAAFFQEWEQLISLEEGDALRFRREIWNMTSTERAKVGRCLANMKLVGNEADRGRIVGAVNRYRCTFEFGTPPTSIESQNLLQTQFIVGDPVVVSTEDGNFALGLGFVVEITTRKIVLALDHPLTGNRVRSQQFSEEDNQDIEGISVFQNGTGWKPPAESTSANDVLYRIDKDEMQGAMGTLRNNLVQLFVSNGDHRRRELIVDLRQPRFSATVDLDEFAGPELLKGLNPDQRQALKKVASAQDYALILGMPGTGKTHTIATIIRALVAKGKSVLLTSHTHSAVDTVLLKLKDSEVKFARVGNVDKVHALIREYTPNYGGAFRTVNDVKNYYESVSVVGATCLSITHGLFSMRKFDYCIVDEASQITLPACVGPLRYAETFILVGDHYQLPPVIRNAEAEDLGISLFRRLSEAHPGAVVNLEHQYRMNADIMSVANRLIYNERLKCGTLDVAEGMLEVPRPDRLRELHVDSTCPGNPFYASSVASAAGHNKECSCWLEHLIKPSNRVIFADTDAVPAVETRRGDLVQNEVEADLVFQVVESLIACGLEESAIGVVSPYRSQLKLLSHKLRRRKAIEINTVDKYQGRDKDCIVISLVRSNGKNNVGDLLRDWRRVNVAVTRPRQKLILVGSRSTLSSTALFQDFFEFLEERDWLYTLPAKANSMHSIPGENTPSVVPSQAATGNLPEKENSLSNGVISTADDAARLSKPDAGSLRAARQREMALSRLKARGRQNPILGDILEELR